MKQAVLDNSSNRHSTCDSKQTGHYDSIIRIYIIRSNSLDACTCGGLFCSTEPLSMGFTLPHTRLAFNHLRSLSCQRLGPPVTLTTWISLLYVRLIDPLELLDVILTWILTLIIYTTYHHEISPQNSWNYVYLTPNSCSSCNNHHFYLKHPILMPKHHEPTITCLNSFQAY